MKKVERLFDIDEPSVRTIPQCELPRDEFPKKILAFCSNTSFTNVLTECIHEKPESYTIHTDRGPSAIDAPLSRRSPKDLDPVESLRINDHFTPPVHGFPCELNESIAFTSKWTVRYQKACGAPEHERADAVAAFGRAFAAEVSLVAPYIIRKVALADISAADGSPVGSSYSSSHPIFQFAPRLRLGELGPRPTLPSSHCTAAADGLIESSPKPCSYIYNSIRYEVVNHRHHLALYRSHENCLRVAKHRLNNASRIASTGVAFLHQAPSAVVEYCGFRVYATGVLPLSPRAPLLYGSNHNGANEKDPYIREDDQAVAAMRTVASTLNIKGHWLGSGIARQFLYSNGELNIKRGMDNRLYIVGGEERLFPPCTTNNRVFPNGYLYRFLRPELCKHSKKSKVSRMPLSSDAFSNFGIIRADEHDREVALMSEVLRQQIINDATNRILQRLMPCTSVSLGIQALKEEGGVATLLHRYGVNVRFIGEISTRLSNRYFRLRAQQVSADGPEMIVPISILLSILRIEMIARAMKVMVRRLLRNRSVARIGPFISGCLRYQATSSSSLADGSEKEKDKTVKVEVKPGASDAEAKPRQRAVVLVDDTNEGEDEEEEEEDTFQAEDDYYNCFDRTIWPIIDAKFGAGEGFTILRFTPNQICVNAQVPFNSVDAVAEIVMNLLAATGISIAKRKLKWQSDGAEELLDAHQVADEVVNGVTRAGEPVDICAAEPIPIIWMGAIPPMVFPSGEFLHMIGVARSTVRTASLAVELEYLRPNRKRNQLFMSVVDYSTIYCLDCKLTEDQDILRWMKFRKDAVKRLLTKRTFEIQKQETEARGIEAQALVHEDDPVGEQQHDEEQSAAPVVSLHKGVEHFFVEENVIGFPLVNANAQVAKDCILVHIDERTLLDVFDLQHRDVIRITKKDNHTQLVVVIGANRFIYVTEYVEAPPEANEGDDVGDESALPKQCAFALLASNRAELDERYKVEKVHGFGYLRYYEPAELGIEKTQKQLSPEKVRLSKHAMDEFESSEDDNDSLKHRLIGTDDRDGVCYFFGRSWDVVEYNTKPSTMDNFVPEIRSGHRILLKSTGATFRVIGIREGQLWVCQERVDALPRPLTSSEIQHVSMLHLMDRVSYDEQVLYFMGRHFQRSLASLNKFTLYYGQKILLRSGPLAGVVGIVLGTEADVVHMINITSKEIIQIPGRTRDEVFKSMTPLLVGCVLDLSVFEPTEPTTFEAITTTGAHVVLDIRAERLLDMFGVVQGSLVEVLLGPFTLNKCRALGWTPGRLWVTLEVGNDPVKIGTNALPLKIGEYRVLSEAPVTVRSNPNRRLALRASDRQSNKSLRLSAPLDSFSYLCATGIPVEYDRHSDVCGVFNLFHGQVVLVAKDVFSKWEPMTVVGVFQGEIWVVPDGHAAAVPLDGFSGTELLQNYSIIEVRGHTELRTFHDFLHLEGFDIMPFTVHSKVTKDGVMVHVLEENGELIGLDKTDAAIAAIGPPFPIHFGDYIQHLLPEARSLFLASASALWKRKREYEHFIVMGVYEGRLYVVREGSRGCVHLSLEDHENMTVVKNTDVIPFSASALVHLQRELRLKKRKSNDSDAEHRRTFLDDALQLTEPPAFPPQGLPQISKEQLLQAVPTVLDFAFHQFCERFAEAKIPDGSLRLVIHWMLSWFGCRLEFEDTRRDGLLKLAAIETHILKRPLPLPTLLDYDAYRVRHHAQLRKDETRWGVAPQQLAEWRSEAFGYCLPRTVDAQAANRSLRLLPSLEEYVKRGEVPPAAALPFSENQRDLVLDTSHSVSNASYSVPTNASERDALCKSSRAMLDLAQRKKRMAGEAKLANVVVVPVRIGDARLPQVVEESWQGGISQLRRQLELQIGSHLASEAQSQKQKSVRNAPQDASCIHRYKTSEGGVIFLDSSNAACWDVFQMRRGEVYRYSSGDMAGVNIVILGAVDGVLWRYEERLSSQDKIMDEQARPFFGDSGDEIRQHHAITLVGQQPPRTCDPFYFPRVEGALLKFDMEEASCAAFGVNHGQRYVMKKEPYIVPPLPLCRHGPVLTVIGVYGQNIYFAADGSGAFSVNSNDPVRDLGLEPLYFTVVGAFAVERKNWYRCPVEIVRRGKTYNISCCLDTSLALIQMWHMKLRFGSVVRLPTNPEDIERWRLKHLALNSKRKSRKYSQLFTDNEPAPTHVLAQVVGVRCNTLYRVLLHEDVAHPFTPEEWSNLEILSEVEAEESPWDGGPMRHNPMKSIAFRAEKQQAELFQYVDTSGGDSGLMLRPPSMFKCFNSFYELCLYDQTAEALAPFGVAALDWVKIFVAQEWKWSIIIGVRSECLWRIDEEDIGVLAQELRFIPDCECPEAKELAQTFASRRLNNAITPTIPMASLFNHCTSFKDLVKHYSLMTLGTAKMRGFVG